MQRWRHGGARAVGRSMALALAVFLRLVCDRFLRLQHLPVIARPWTAASEAADIAAAAAFLVFLLAYTPCVATVATQRRQIGGRWTAVGVGMPLTLAWLLAVAVFQIGAALS